jgi:uncharacterized protein DUF2628
MLATPVLGNAGAVSAGLPPSAGGLSRLLDSIVFPPYVRARQDERRVRPALAVLFRIAVGPHADYYARRFVGFERRGRGAPSWNWPAFALPPVWAFYRKLWGYGIACALLPLLGVLAFTSFEFPRGASVLAWWACAALFCWLLPSVVCATFANAIYYRRVRRLVRRAEKHARTAEAAAKRLLQRRPTDVLQALLLGTGILLCAGSLIGSQLQIAYHAHTMRAALEQVIAAVRPLQRQVEDVWQRSRAIPLRPDYRAVRANPAYGLIDAVDLNAKNGRVRIDLGAAVPELQGKSILLAPAVDAWQKLHWLCVPIDIPAAYLPPTCDSQLRQ